MVTNHSTFLLPDMNELCHSRSFGSASLLLHSVWCLHDIFLCAFYGSKLIEGILDKEPVIQGCQGAGLPMMISGQWSPA